MRWDAKRGCPVTTLQDLIEYALIVSGALALATFLGWWALNGGII